MRDFHLPGRSPVHGTRAMAATPNPLATRTAVEVMRDGGNAIDAAIAASAVLSVVEPHQTGIGGDCFALIAKGGRRPLIAYNGSGRAPKAADWARFREMGLTVIEEGSPHAVTVPGSIDAWATLAADHGRKDLGTLLQPAIGYAENGYPVHSRTAFDWARHAQRTNTDPSAVWIYLPGGRAPHAGEVHRQPHACANSAPDCRSGAGRFLRRPGGRRYRTASQITGRSA